SCCLYRKVTFYKKLTLDRRSPVMSWPFAAGAAVFVAVALNLSSTVSDAETTGAAEECDRLAAHSTDPSRPPGIIPVDFAKINADSAISACQRALAAQPDDARMAFQLARALLKAGNLDAAISFLTKAAENGHVKAMVNLGDVYRNEMNDAPEAVRWF